MSDRNTIRQLARAGIILPDTVNSVTTPAASYAMDAASLAPTQMLATNGGIPAFLTTWVDPKVIETLVTRMAASQILGETKKGDWTTTTAMFVTAEPAGQVATYGDWSANGSSSANVNYPSRESYHFQTWTEWGDKELAQMGAGYIDWAAQKDNASALTIAKFMNRSYLYGVSGLKNYGLTNDPSLIAPVASALNYATASPEDIANDFVRQVGLLVTQSNGLIDGSETLVWAAAPSAINDIRRTNNYGLSAEKKIRESYPNIELIPVPEYDTTSGRLAQLWAREIEGQPTGEVAFTEKMRAHAVERYSTYTRQKKSAGTFGAVIYRPFAVTQTLGI